MKKIKILLLIATTLFLFSCESNTYEEISGVVLKPTYSKNISPIINSKCVSCHKNGNQYPNLESYAEVKESTENGTLICRIEGTCGNIMPQSGKMPQNTIDIIKLWKTNGYMNE